jgi:hypothetical protein
MVTNVNSFKEAKIECSDARFVITFVGQFRQPALEKCAAAKQLYCSHRYRGPIYRAREF